MSIGGRASQESQASSGINLGQGENLSFGSQFGAGKGGSAQDAINRSTGRTGGSSYTTQDVYGAQAPFLTDAWRQGGMAADQAGRAVNRFTGGQGAQYGNTVSGAVDSLGRMGDPQALIDAQSRSLQAGLQDTFADGLNQIGGEAAQMGAFGGSRHGLREAALGGELADAYTRGYGDIVANANNTAINANNSAITGAGIGNQLGLQNALAGLQPAQALAGIIGGPTVLGQGGSSQFGTTDSYGRTTGRSFDTNINQGVNLGYGYDNRYGENTSLGQGESAGFGIGLK